MSFQLLQNLFDKIQSFISLSPENSWWPCSELIMNFSSSLQKERIFLLFWPLSTKTFPDKEGLWINTTLLTISRRPYLIIMNLSNNSLHWKFSIKLLLIWSLKELLFLWLISSNSRFSKLYPTLFQRVKLNCLSLKWKWQCFCLRDKGKLYKGLITATKVHFAWPNDKRFDQIS